MQPEQVKEMLSNYRYNVGRCEHLSIMIKEMRGALESITKDVARDLAESGNRQLDGMPHGTTVSNPTERMGIMLASGFMPKDAAEIEKEITEAEAELKDKSTAVRCVNAWMAGLSGKRKWIIEHQIFDGMTYAEMMTAYRADFVEACSKDQLRRLSKEALGAIYKIAA